MVKKLQFLSILLFLVFCFSTVLADDGKIVGNVTDAETGEPLPGTNVYIEGTTLGAAVDMDGFFVILNVPPGDYTVIANIIGYKEVRMTSVDIGADATTQLNFSLEATTLESAETIVIEAERPLIRKDISATQIELSADYIQTNPTGSVTELLQLQAGFEITQDVDKGAGLSIRGGEIRESDFRVDNISMKSNLTDVSFMTVPKTSIKNIQLLTGGFNAEYGQVRSGLLNVTTDQGSNKYHLAIDYRHAYPQYKHFGPDAYAKDGRIWQMFNGSQAFTGITTDDVVLFYETNGAQGYPLTFEGWNSVSERYLQDNDPTNDLTPQEALELWKWRHRGREYADEPDYDFDATFSGPLPFVKDTYFSTSYRREQRLYAYPLSKKKAVTNMFSLKLNSSITNNLKLGFTGMYGDVDGTAPDRRGGNLSSIGVAFPGSYGALAGMISGDNYSSQWTADAFGFYNMYGNWWLSLGEGDLLRLSLDGTYVINPTTFLEARYTFAKTHRFTWRALPRDLTSIHEINGRWYDETPIGTYGVNTPDQTGYFGINGHARRFEDTFDYLHQIKFDLVSQVDRYNQVKMGIQIDIPIFEVRSMRQVKESTWAALGDTVMGDWYLLDNPDQMYKDMDVMYALEPKNWQWWDESPFLAAFYIQDKLEFEGMIANLGLRFDYHNPRTKGYKLETPWDLSYRETNWDAGGEYWWGTQRTEEVKAKIYIQPRVGLSFPASETTKLYFNYGHFYQTPYPYYWYSYAGPLSGPGFVMPNPDLEAPRTVAYELGVEQTIADMFLIHVAGYYKDVTGEDQLLSGVDWDHTVENQWWSNNLYRDIRGVEIRVEKSWGRYTTFWANYDYRLLSRGYTVLPYVYENPLENEAQETNAAQTKLRAQPRFRAGLTVMTPLDFGQLWGGWSATFLYRWDDRGEFIWDPQVPTAQQHWIQRVDYSNTDLRVEKIISAYGMNATLYLDIKNLWNQKFLNTGHFNQAEGLAYREALRLPWEEGDQKGDDKWGTWDKDYIQLGWMNWIQFLNPRQIFFGIRFEM